MFYSPLVRLLSKLHEFGDGFGIFLLLLYYIVSLPCKGQTHCGITLAALSTRYCF